MMFTQSNGKPNQVKVRPRNVFFGDDIVYKADLPYDNTTLVLFDLRRYMKIIVSLLTVFVSMILIMFLLIFLYYCKNELIQASNLSVLNAKIQTMGTNAVMLTSFAVPLVQDAQVGMNGVASMVAAEFNLTTLNSQASAARIAGTTGARKLAQVKHVHLHVTPPPSPPVTTTTTTSSEDLSSLSPSEQLQVRTFKHMVFNSVHHVLNTTNTKLNQVDIRAVNSLLNGTGNFLEMLAKGGFHELLLRLDHMLTDYEKLTLGFAYAAGGMSSTPLASKSRRLFL